MSKINKLLWRPEHSRQEISSNDKNNLKEFQREEPELLMPNENNDLYNFGEKKEEEKELSTNIEELTDTEQLMENEIELNELNETENLKYVDQEGYEFEYINEDDYDDNDSVYSDEDGNLIRYIDKGYKKKNKVNKINYKYIIIFILVILLFIFLIKRFRN
jgi:hypothetical protein